MSHTRAYEILQQLPQVALYKAFVLYRLPNKSATTLMVGDALETASLSDVLNQNGFAFLPAINSPRHKSYLIVPDEELALESLDTYTPPSGYWPKGNIPPYIATQSAYLEQAQHIIDTLRGGHVEKAILSRIKDVYASGFNPWETFKKLCAAYPTVMVYWVSIPGEGTWMGATPETLLKIDNGLAETMSLAGTQADKGLPLDAVIWGQKEQEEQQIVSDNIEGLIHKYFPAVEVSAQGPKTISTGALLHLKTTFQWRVPHDVSALESFITALHPTPAIVGKPREAALNLITETEKHDRAYYTGLIGPVDYHNGLTHLFVNLRCMQVMEGYVALYLGGGITAASNPESEWEETELKAGTLLKAL